MLAVPVDRPESLDAPASDLAGHQSPTADLTWTRAQDETGVLQLKQIRVGGLGHGGPPGTRVAEPGVCPYRPPMQLGILYPSTEIEASAGSVRDFCRGV